MAKGHRGRVPQRPGGGAGGLDQMMKQVQKMQADMAAAQDALAEATVEGSAGGGMVKVVVTGSGDLQSVHIAPEVVDPEDVEMLEDLVLAAVSDGLRRAHELAADKMGGLTGGLDLGGLGGLLG
ncbi:MAG TPA: YbaB/EbfC family nucleoid-associated protein [Acidimicrobiia bacterium]|nr:YbaB/EbfC family nucleoid-associated protein [Acidimicrobiia bacterium]